MKKLLLCIFGISACLVLGTVAREGIYGGELILNNLERFSYIVSILSIETHVACGGGIIHDKFILTAAHCVVNKDFSRGLFVTAGTTNRLVDRPPAEKVAVKKIFWPKVYQEAIGRGGDIAVLELNDPLRLPNHRNWKLHLPHDDHKTYENVTAEFAGFGNYRLRGVGPPTDFKLRSNRVKVIANRIGTQQISEQFLCAYAVPIPRYLSPHGAGQGDSGGPLVYNRTVIGIVSASPNGFIETPDRPTVYIRVSHYLNFIHNAMRNIETDDLEKLDLPIPVTASSQ